MNKKSQRIFAGILAVLVSIAMVGSAFIGYFFDSDTPLPNTGAYSTANAEAEYQAQKLRIDAMVEQAKKDPENVPLQTALGNEYYNAGMSAQTVAPTEIQENFKKAVEAYQKVLKTNKDPNIIVDMATSAFYSGDYDLAEKSYNEALVIKPDFINALFNYGIFLSQAKQDWAGAINQWQKALPLTQNSSEKETIEAMISQAQSQLNANQTTDGVSNPILKNGE
ncbi:tetratricopeptide repeat protein [Desulfosporosinus nitroreducens]|uniref:Tetratricopeptide repeat protein n=1 Tax=Desulfosporosinus nitroreducens TaxID=2018668 RepID=A0ABT8QPF2_9FIRM|nr:tetratricopeptide repeat protein [Desulfosporosinus nitroreducens]MDO0821973.1 tetratricopeptide repeat protein [Desulfosporosinus nitroreducens]